MFSLFFLPHELHGLAAAVQRSLPATIISTLFPQISQT